MPKLSLRSFPVITWIVELLLLIYEVAFAPILRLFRCERIDYLPTELIVHIFRFLPADDVARFKLLNSRMKNVIQSNSNVLRRIQLNVRIRSSHANDNKCSLNIETHRGLLILVLTRNEDNTVTTRSARCMRTSERELRICDIFFDDGKQLSVEKVFTIMLRKGEITLTLVNPIHPIFIRAFENAIASTECNFSKIITSLDRGDETPVSDLKFIARRMKCTPPLRIRYYDNILTPDWLKLINQLALSYKDIAFYCYQTCILFQTILEKINQYPNDPVNFYIDYDYDTEKMHDFYWECEGDEECGFNSHIMTHIIDSLSEKFLEYHAPRTLPDSITFSLKHCVREKGHKCVH